MNRQDRRHRRLIELLEPRQFMSTVTVANATAHEGDGSLVFQVTLDAPAAEDVVVRYTATPGTALPRKDYRPAQGKVTIPAGETTWTISIELKDDTRHEATETVKLNLAAKGATLADKTAIGTIKDNDAAPTVSVKNADVKEGHAGTKVVKVIVSLSEPADVPLTVAYATSDQTPFHAAATGGDDYVASSGLITFKAGETKKSVLLSVKGDAVKEEDEVFLVTVKQPAGAPGVGDAVGVVTIKDDDKAVKKGEPILKVEDVTVLEGESGATSQAGLIVRLSKPSSQDVTFRYSYGPKKSAGRLAVAPMLGAQTAKGSGKITIPAGQTSATVPVTVVGNGLYQDNQWVEVTLSQIKGARPINGQASLSGGIDVVDDEPVLLTDFNGTLVLGISGVVRHSDLYLTHQAVAGVSMPVIYSNTSLVGGTLGRFEPNHVTAVAENAYLMNTGALTAGTLNLAGASTYVGHTILASDWLVKSGAGALTLTAGTVRSTGYLGGSGAVSVSAGMMTTLYPSVFLEVDAGPGQVRLTMSEAEVRSRILAGLSGGTGAIKPALTLLSVDHRWGVGYLVEEDGRVWVKAAQYGDADLDGVVDEKDRAIVLGAMASGAAASWGAGDFNYDGVIGADDLSLLDRNLGAGNTVILVGSD